MNDRTILSFVQTQIHGLRINMRVQPGASKSELCGVHADLLKLKVRARPVDGAANQAVCEFLAELLKVSKSSVSIVKGETSRTKTVLVQGDPQRLIDCLLAALRELEGNG